MLTLAWAFTEGCFFMQPRCENVQIVLVEASELELVYTRQSYTDISHFSFVLHVVYFLLMLLACVNLLSLIRVKIYI